jgi:UrcA family protein
MKTFTIPRLKLSRAVYIVVAASALTGISPAALAADKIVVEKATVRFGDLNLEAEAGAQALVSRLHRVTTRLCGEGRPSGPLLLQKEVKSRFIACRNEAMQTAVNTLDRPLVTQLYRGSYANAQRIAAR